MGAQGCFLSDKHRSILTHSGSQQKVIRHRAVVIRFLEQLLSAMSCQQRISLVIRRLCCYHVSRGSFLYKCGIVTITSMFKVNASKMINMCLIG